MIQKKDGQIYTYTEYNKEFIAAAKRLGGRWNSTEKSWTFKEDLEEEVTNLLTDFFGYQQEKMNIIVDISKEECFDNDTYTSVGKQWFQRRGRDSEVRLHHDISIITGTGFYNRGGSMKYPTIGNPSSDLQLLVRNVPKNLLHEISFPYTIKEETIKSKYTDLSIEELEKMKKEIEQEIISREK